MGLQTLPYVVYPRSVKQMAKEIKKITDDFWEGKVNQYTLQIYIHHLANNGKLLAENGKDINPTVKSIIGKKRYDIVMKMLENYQLKLL